MNQFKYAAFAAVLVGTSLVSFESKAIIGGETAEDNVRTAELSKFVIGYNSCTLARISMRHFLGAAHCWSPEGKDFPADIRTGPQGDKRQVLISSLKAHSFVDWENFLKNHSKEPLPSDLKVFEFGGKDSVHFEGIEIAKLNLEFTPRAGDRVVISGYGGFREEFAFNDENGRAHYNAISDGSFRTGVRLITEVNDTFILLSQFDELKRELRLARGDSGGPLFNEAGEIIGVNAFIDRVNYPDAYSGISRLDRFARSSLSEESIAEWVSQFVDKP